MAIKITVDTASEFLWIKTVVDQGAINCRDSMEFLNKEFELSLEPRTVTYEHNDGYVIDLPKLVEALEKEEPDG